MTKPLSVAGPGKLAWNRGSRNAVRRHAAASLSPTLSPQVLLLRSYPGELGKRGRPASRRPGRSPIPGALIETICSAPERRKRAARSPPSFLSSPQAAPRGGEPSPRSFFK